MDIPTLIQRKVDLQKTQVIKSEAEYFMRVLSQSPKEKKRSHRKPGTFCNL